MPVPAGSSVTASIRPDAPWYTTRERVMSTMDVKASAYASPQIDAVIESASRQVELLCHRIFYPWTGTLKFAFPNSQHADIGRLWLDDHSLISLTSMTSGGVSVDTASVFLEPSVSGPPYSYIEIDRSSSAVLSSNSGTPQRSIVLTGLWGYRNDEETAGTLSGSIISTDVTLGGNGANYDVGDVLRIGTERILVVGKAWTTAGQTATLAASNAAQSLTVSDSTAFTVGEELLIDTERVLIRDIAGSVLVVQRAWSGSTLAAHTTATIYYARTLTVTRGALGTTAASHTSGATIYRWVPPGPVRDLTTAYALDTFVQGGAAYGRTIGSGGAERTVGERGIQALEERVYGAYGRKNRARAV